MACKRYKILIKSGWSDTVTFRLTFLVEIVWLDQSFSTDNVNTPLGMFLCKKSALVTTVGPGYLSRWFLSQLKISCCNKLGNLPYKALIQSVKAEFRRKCLGFAGVFSFHRWKLCRQLPNWVLEAWSTSSALDRYFSFSEMNLPKWPNLAKELTFPPST